ncbi:MAG: hypothetical protein JXQ30_04045 [Spirochaetes bacterium]|nr:hypothetical protein [Spirochaetota bacterium]
MWKKLSIVVILLLFPSVGLPETGRLFDLSAVGYFEDGRFTFIQTFLKENVSHGPRRGGFMPQEGEVKIYFQSSKHKTSYVMTTESYQKGRLLYSTEAAVDRFGTTMRYVVYGNEGDPEYDYRYNSESGGGSVCYRDEDDTLVRKKVTVPPHAYSMMTIPYIIGALTVTDSERHSFDAVVGDGRKLGLYLQRIGAESVQVKGRVYACSKFEMGMSGVIGLFVPKMVFYVDDGSKLPVRQKMMGGSIIEYEPVD